MILNIRLRANTFFIKKCVFHTFTRCLTSDKNSRDYQNFAASDIPTFYFQSSLPRLPIPDLKQTCEKYLHSVKPLIDDKDYNHTKEIVNDFLLHEGLKLQQILIARDNFNNQTSYISKPWFDRYLSSRYPLPINSNPLYILHQDKRHEYNDQLIKTCNVVISTLRLMKSIQKNSLEPTIDYLFRSKEKQKIVRTILKWSPTFLATKFAYLLKTIPKDMVQFERIFGRTRIPEHKLDITVQYENTNHIIVLRNGHIFSVKVLNEFGEIESPEVIFDRINHIYQLKPTDTNCSIASLTTLDRDNWAKLHKHLSTKLDNKIQMKEIDSALFCVSIENSASINDNLQWKLLFAGDGINRWFDKSLTVAIDYDGTVALSLEHSWGDGRMAVRLVDEIYNDITSSPFITPKAHATNITKYDSHAFVREIKFNVDATIERGIKQAIENHTLKIHSLKLNNFRFTKLNKNVCKNFKLSPDSIAQLGYQLAFYKQHGKFVSTYEPCNTQKFLHGRTEAIRPCTTATQQLCYAICRKTENNSKLFALINNCSQLHIRIIQQSADGQGFDRHLYCLRYLAQEEGLEEPNLFRDTSYTILTRNTIISTTVSSKALHSITFGPSILDGYGIWYKVENEGIELTMSYYPNFSNGNQFLDLLEESYNEIFNILDSKKLSSGHGKELK